jgi:hypothetical protein
MQIVLIDPLTQDAILVPGIASNASGTVSDAPLLFVIEGGSLRHVPHEAGGAVIPFLKVHFHS